VGIGRTRVGYCGGKSKDPTYYNMKDHTESMQIEYDPNVITFEDLFALFTSIHNPCHVSWSVQYASIFFYNDEKEKKYAEHQFELIEKEKNKKTQTLIKPLTTFTVAEDYHQKYYFRSNPKLVKLFQLNDQEIRDSTLILRLNGLCFMDGRGKKKFEENDKSSKIKEYFGVDEVDENLKQALQVLNISV